MLKYFLMRIRNIKKALRPREKLLDQGPPALSDRELVAIILGTGIAGCDVMRLAGAVVKAGAGGMSLAALGDVRGLGRAQICRILASMEFARRRLVQTQRRIRAPDDLLAYTAHIAELKQEHLLAISVNGSGEVHACRLIAVGTLTNVSVHPREVFADAIADRAAGVYLAHNHPSGSPEPSKSDIRLTRKLAEAGRLVGIPVIDHLILCGRSWFSMKKHRLM